ncbi:IclR family transcriptional regulator [Halalkalibacterium ligniniphilum]|uniref:IclR family transcriptional regulator n=1 Tax=Halalkalibacterium ligniniphilum TaxID=1134413 RepID=UPI00034C3E34|nr:IclR family transcriptional regulator [Halalkalibacterium ligniniphilum]
MRYPAISQHSVSSMRNALRLLKLFTLDEAELSVSELAKKLEVGLSTAHRLTSTLVHEGFLVKDPLTKNYRLSSSILAMGHTILSQIDLCHFSTPILERLTKETGETSHLSILKENQVIYLQKIDSLHPVHLLSHAGRQNHAHCTSSGQIILAFQSDEEIERVIKMGLIPYTSKTITSPARFKQRLREMKEMGYSLSEEELHYGVSSISAPVKNALGTVVASVSIAGPITRINQQKTDQLIKSVKKAAEEMSKQMMTKNRR